MLQYQSILTNISNLSKHYRELDRLSGANFNLFRIINVCSDELRHSLFLADMFNPKGSHGQGGVFLQLFIDQLEIESFYIDDADVVVEKSIGRVEGDDGGRIDIYITDHRGHDIVIENKIYANDQPKQLIRYYRFAPNNVFYLTLDGHEPSESSVKGESEKLEHGEHFRFLSYKYDITEWLESCRKEASQMPLLREGISHYINLIKHLTGDSNNKAMRDEIIEVALQSAQNLRSVTELAANINAIKAKTQWKFWKALRVALEDVGLAIEGNDKNTVSSERTWKYYHNKDQYFGLWVEIYKNDNICIHWGVEVDENIYSGFTLERNGEGGISDLPEFDWLRQIVKDCDSSYKSTKYWLGWKYPKTKLDFRSFNSEDIFNLTNTATLTAIVNDIADVAVNDINYLKEKVSNKLN